MANGSNITREHFPAENRFEAARTYYARSDANGSDKSLSSQVESISYEQYNEGAGHTVNISIAGKDEAARAANLKDVRALLENAGFTNLEVNGIGSHLSITVPNNGLVAVPGSSALKEVPQLDENAVMKVTQALSNDIPLARGQTLHAAMEPDIADALIREELSARGITASQAGLSSIATEQMSDADHALRGYHGEPLQTVRAGIHAPSDVIELFEDSYLGNGRPHVVTVLEVKPSVAHKAQQIAQGFTDAGIEAVIRRAPDEVVLVAPEYGDAAKALEAIKARGINVHHLGSSTTFRFTNANDADSAVRVLRDAGITATQPPVRVSIEVETTIDRTAEILGKKGVIPSYIAAEIEAAGRAAHPPVVEGMVAQQQQQQQMAAERTDAKVSEQARLQAEAGERQAMYGRGPASGVVQGDEVRPQANAGAKNPPGFNAERPVGPLDTKTRPMPEILADAGADTRIQLTLYKPDSGLEVQVVNMKLGNADPKLAEEMRLALVNAGFQDVAFNAATGEITAMINTPVRDGVVPANQSAVDLFFDDARNVGIPKPIVTSVTTAYVPPHALQQMQQQQQQANAGGGKPPPGNSGPAAVDGDPYAPTPDDPAVRARVEQILARQDKNRKRPTKEDLFDISDEARAPVPVNLPEGPPLPHAFARHWTADANGGLTAPISANDSLLMEELEKMGVKSTVQDGLIVVKHPYAIGLREQLVQSGVPFTEAPTAGAVNQHQKKLPELPTNDNPTPQAKTGEIRPHMQATPYADMDGPIVAPERLPPAEVVPLRPSNAPLASPAASAAPAQSIIDPGVAKGYADLNARIRAKEVSPTAAPAELPRAPVDLPPGYAALNARNVPAAAASDRALSPLGAEPLAQQGEYPITADVNSAEQPQQLLLDRKAARATGTPTLVPPATEPVVVSAAPAAAAEVAEGAAASKSGMGGRTLGTVLTVGVPVVAAVVSTVSSLQNSEEKAKLQDIYDPSAARITRDAALGNAAAAAGTNLLEGGKAMFGVTDLQQGKGKGALSGISSVTGIASIYVPEAASLAGVSAGLLGPASFLAGGAYLAVTVRDELERSKPLRDAVAAGKHGTPQQFFDTLPTNFTSKDDRLTHLAQLKHNILTAAEHGEKAHAGKLRAIFDQEARQYMEAGGSIGMLQQELKAQATKQYETVALAFEQALIQHPELIRQIDGALDGRKDGRADMREAAKIFRDRTISAASMDTDGKKGYSAAEVTAGLVQRAGLHVNAPSGKGTAR